MSQPPKQLAAIESSDGNERLLVELLPRDGSLRLLQQTWSGRVGWFTQQSLSLQPDQIAALRNALGLASSMVRMARRTSDDKAGPQIVAFPAAHAESA